MCGELVASPLLSRLLSPAAAHSLRVRRLSSLRAHQQGHMLQLAALIRDANTHVPNSESKTFVACRVVAHAEGGALFSATGVNHALHRELNAGQTLRGILRGCAEQNALGVAAASGHRYAAITDVFLYASAAAPSAAVLLPCPECWRLLSDVAAMRHRAGTGPLRLFVHAGGEAPAEGAAAAQRPPADIDITVVLSN